MAAGRRQAIGRRGAVLERHGRRDESRVSYRGAACRPSALKPKDFWTAARPSRRHSIARPEFGPFFGEGLVNRLVAVPAELDLVARAFGWKMAGDKSEGELTAFGVKQVAGWLRRPWPTRRGHEDGWTRSFREIKLIAPINGDGDRLNPRVLRSRRACHPTTS